MEEADVFALIFAARRSLADTLEGLTDTQWSEQSLCSEWTCRDVLAHLVMPLEVPMWRMALGITLRLGNFDRYAAAHAKADNRTPDELVSALRRKAESRFKPPMLGPEAPLTDCVVHGQDICRPLGIKREIPEDAMKVVLDFLVSPAAARGQQKKGLTAGLRFDADDVDWSSGEGPVVTGPGEALAVALTGRQAALEDLGGDGLDMLRSRL